MNAYKKAIAHWGKEAQIMKTLEELDELKDVIYKDLIEGHVDYDHLAEEIADVHNMLIQLMLIYNISAQTIEDNMTMKMRRTVDRIENEGSDGE
jgi:NTP pyrophosphatase (non-canonical NTP hydrolase)